MTSLDLLVGLLIAIGLVGIVVPALPGDLLVGGAILLWAVLTGGGAWAFGLLGVALVVLGMVVKYVVPGRRMRDAGVSRSSLVLGGVLGIIGFFVIPVVGLAIGFVLGVFLAESRAGRADAGKATFAAVKAVGLAVLIEFTFCVVAAAVWAVGVLVT